MTDRLKGKVAIITGGAGGMGLEATKLFASEGATVIAGDVQQETLDKVIKDIDPKPGKVVPQVLDISSEESWKKVVDYTVEKFGTVDILINNAAIGDFTELAKTTAEQWQKILSVDVMGAGLGIKTVVPVMEKNGGGAIVNTSSCSAITPDLSVGPIYATAKGSIVPLTKHIAKLEAPHKIRVNSVIPGAVYTPGIAALGLSYDDMAESFKDKSPLPPHAGLPKFIAQAYLFLASDEAQFITGVALPVDGGNTM